MKYTHIPLWFITAFFSFCTSYTHATCLSENNSGITPPSAGYKYYNYIQSQAVDTSHLNDTGSVQIGGSLGYITVEISAGISGNAGYNCYGTANVVELKIHPDFVPSAIRNIYGAYPSRIPGLGILSMTINGVSFPGSYYFQQLTKLQPTVITARIDFIKTGPLQSIDSIFNGIFAYETASVNGIDQLLFEYRFREGSTTPPITRPTCTLQPIAAVPLGTHPISRFTGVNTVTTPQDFTLDLACSGGTQGTSLSATMTLTDNTNTGNTTDALSLSTTQVSGVSVQILRNGIPLHLGPQNGPNSHYLGTISPPPGGGAFSYSIPLQARYKQTGSSVSGGGQANAEALVTINYQ